jgi:hypothetical protein
MYLGVMALKVCTDGSQYRYIDTSPSEFTYITRNKAELNSQFRGIYINNNLIRIWVLFICELSETPD